MRETEMTPVGSRKTKRARGCRRGAQCALLVGAGEYRANHRRAEFAEHRRAEDSWAEPNDGRAVASLRPHPAPARLTQRLTSRAVATFAGANHRSVRRTGSRAATTGDGMRPVGRAGNGRDENK